MSRYEEIMDHIEVTDEMRDRILTNIDREMRLAGGTRRRRLIRPATTWLPLLAAAAALFVVCGVALGVNHGNQSTMSQMPETELAQDVTTSEDADEAAEIAAATENAEDSSDTTIAAAGKEDADSADGLAADTDAAVAVGDSSGEMVTAGYQADEYDSAEAFAAAAGFEVRDIASLPITATETSYMVIGGDLAQISYYDADGNEICYRKSPGTEDNSGDYSDYEFIEDAAIGEHPLTLKGNGERYYLAVWTDGTYAYSINVSDGCSYDEMIAMIEETQ